MSLVWLAQASPQPSVWVQFIPLLLVFGIFYLLIFRPMRKRQKAHAHFLSQLKRGDRVVTNGGLLGEVAAVEEQVVHLRLADNVKVRVLKSAIAGAEGDPTALEGGRR